MRRAKRVVGIVLFVGTRVPQQALVFNVEPVTNLNLEILTRSNDEAQKELDRDRQMNTKEGLSARYDVLGDPRKWRIVESPAYVTPNRFKKSFEQLRAANI